MGRFRARMRPPVQARHAEWSVISSADDLIPPTLELVDLALGAATAASRLDLPETLARAKTQEQRHYLRLWPGEHYRLLAGLVQVLQPRTVVEVGTFTGMGTLALLEYLPSEGRLVTFDIEPWESFPQTLLRREGPL